MNYVLTEKGKEKIIKISQGYTLGQIAIKVDLHRHTVAKIIDGNKGVSLRSIEKVCENLNLDFEENIDYELFPNNTNHGTRNISQSRKLPEPNRSQNYQVQKYKYVQRPLIEQEIYQNMLLINCSIIIKAPKNMGKTTSINQVLKQLKEKENYRTVSISLWEADNSHLSEFNNFLLWLCANISSQLELPPKLNQWDEFTKIYGSKITCSNYLEKYLLQKVKSPLVLFLDNLELLLNENIYKNFQDMLRSWNDKASRNPLWQKLRLVISYAPNLEMKMNPNQSPFNIGMTIELPEFTPEEVQQLAENYQLNLDNSQIRELMNMVGGHPFLLELTFRSLKTCNEMILDQILETAPTKDGIYHSPHLQEYLAILKQHSNLAEVFISIIKGEYLGNMESHTIRKLMNLGLVKYQDGKILVRCELYRLYFESYLGDLE